MMKKDKYRVCLIGALAQISTSHVEGIEATPGFLLSAVCDVDQKLLGERYPRLSENALFTDYRQAVKSEDIDIVIIAATNKLHTPISIAALEAGKIVLCEKPMTHSLESAEQLFHKVKSSASLFVVSYHFRFKPEVKRFLEERDNFGTIKSFRFVSSEELEIEKNWILDKTQGGPWLDWASNALSVLRAVLSGNELFDNFSVWDVRYEFSKEYEIELKADIDITLNAITGNISVDWLSPKGSFTARTELVNDKGDIITLDHAAGQILINDDLYWSGKDIRYIDVYQDFLHRLNNNNTNIEIGMQDARIIQAVKDFKTTDN